MCENKEILESLRFYLEESDDSKLDTEPIKIDGTLCIKCGNNLAGYCIDLLIDCPYVKCCPKYKGK